MDISRTSNAERGSALPPSRQPADAIVELGTTAAAAPVTSTVQVKPTSDAKKHEPTPAEIAQSVEAINKFLKPVANNIQFSIDQDSGTTLVKIVDTETQAILRQIPSVDALSMAKELGKLQGLLVREKA